MNLIYAPNPVPRRFANMPRQSIFLAGSIENGTASDWQSKVIQQLQHTEIIDIYNPRRLDWDWSWEQKITNPKFVEQVNWELDALDQADYIFMYFDPGTKSVVSMLEFGLHARQSEDCVSQEMYVCCPEGFWRKGNVDIVCERYNINTVDSIEEFTDMFKDL